MFRGTRRQCLAASSRTVATSAKVTDLQRQGEVTAVRRAPTAPPTVTYCRTRARRFARQGRRRRCGRRKTGTGARTSAETGLAGGHPRRPPTALLHSSPLSQTAAAARGPRRASPASRPGAFAVTPVTVRRSRTRDEVCLISRRDPRKRERNNPPCARRRDRRRHALSATAARPPLSRRRNPCKTKPSSAAARGGRRACHERPARVARPRHAPGARPGPLARS